MPAPYVCIPDAKMDITTVVAPDSDRPTTTKMAEILSNPYTLYGQDYAILNR